ncbi:c-type cytochrome [Alkalicoccobacillus plakortidis]|jgi:cytochrome c550|uniref:Cytochrome c n=1 Tax=Alkalicoccobacillus plakortidis TaxID=444060 RepID=A0ABT0XQ65_9BACI|nr:cytochrome c [Alkalicoccobacillus plakortidis]MCM2677835.1 cytochrome c [Alkalicoccobacillus plakortidis]
MKGSPLIPFALIALIGIVLMAVMSAYGVNERNAQEAEENGAGEEEPVEIDDPIVAGEELSQQSCINCHGGDLAGGSVGPAINGLDLSVEEISDIIQNGYGSMPAQTQYSAEEADAISEYLLSISE